MKSFSNMMKMISKSMVIDIIIKDTMKRILGMENQLVNSIMEKSQRLHPLTSLLQLVRR